MSEGHEVSCTLLNFALKSLPVSDCFAIKYLCDFRATCGLGPITTLTMHHCVRGAPQVGIVPAHDYVNRPLLRANPCLAAQEPVFTKSRLIA